MQEPLRLRGDVGHNLDPFGRFEPSVLMKTIVDVGLVQVPKTQNPHYFGHIQLLLGRRCVVSRRMRCWQRKLMT